MRLYIISILVIVALSTASAGFCFSIKSPEKTLEVPAYRIRGTEYLPLTLICDAYGIKWKWDATSMTVDLNKDNTLLRLRVGEYKLYANGTINIQEKPVVMYKGAVCIPADFLRTVFNKLFLAAERKELTVAAGYKASEAQVAAPQVAAPYYTIKKIVLDPGHGGHDPGAIGRDGIKEKYIALDIAKKVKAALVSEGLDVIMTRYDDRFVPLWKRVEVGNLRGVDLFVSIHANASRRRGLKGFEVYYLSEDIDDYARAKAAAKEKILEIDKNFVYRHSDLLDTILWDLELSENRRNSVELGNSILNNIDTAKRGIKCARFFVLKGVRVPAVLVEVGYISNRDECAKLGWGEYRSDIARRIAAGIMDYKRRFEETDGFTR